MFLRNTHVRGWQLAEHILVYLVTLSLHFKIFIWMWQHNIALFNIFPWINLWQRLSANHGVHSYKHVDITHSNEVNPAPFTLSWRLLSIPQQLCEDVLRENSFTELLVVRWHVLWMLSDACVCLRSLWRGSWRSQRRVWWRETLLLTTSSPSSPSERSVWSHTEPTPETQLHFNTKRYIWVYLYSSFYDTIVAKQLYRKLSFYNIFIYCRNLI